MKENIYTFVLFFCHLILTLIAHGMIMKLQTLIICSVASLFVADTIFFIFFNLSKTRYTLLPGINIINKLLCCNQATLLIWQLSVDQQIAFHAYQYVIIKKILNSARVKRTSYSCQYNSESINYLCLNFFKKHTDIELCLKKTHTHTHTHIHNRPEPRF